MPTATGKPDNLAVVKGLGSNTRKHTVTFLPEPPRSKRYSPIISVDDHVVEARHMFEGRMPKHLVDRAPRVEETPEGLQQWVYEDMRQPNMGISATVGRPINEMSTDPGRFEHMRKGAYDPTARVLDMDLNGIYASLNFPSSLCGFAGQRFQLGHDPELALAVVRAWNDWYLEEWVQAYPDRFIACQIPWLLDPEIAAQEIRRNAERGFTAVTFSEGPHELGLPSLHSGYWEPFFQACEETETVICLHVGSSSTIPTTAPDAPFDVAATLFFGYAMFFACDWLFSLVPVKHPNLKIALSEGGIGWVPALLDRLDHTLRYNQIYGTWVDIDLTPTEVLQRNFYFCAIDDATGFRVVDRIGVDQVMVEADYPHMDSMWPNTQQVIHDQVKHLSEDVIQKICWGNAARIFKHPVPPEIQQNPELFALSV